jgi:hypothetical protein
MLNKAKAVLKWLGRLPRRIGQRGILLLIFAFTVFGYGFGLVFGYHPTFDAALGISDFGFGLIFIADGVILTLGALLRWGRFPYSVAATVSFFWVFILTGFWAGPFGWAASMSWVGMGLVQVFAVVWPEPVAERNILKRAIATHQHAIDVVADSDYSRTNNEGITGNDDEIPD